MRPLFTDEDFEFANRNLLGGVFARAADVGWPGQSRRLHDLLPGAKALVRFTADEGADGHCEPLAVGLRGERVLDWSERQLG